MRPALPRDLRPRIPLSPSEEEGDVPPTPLTTPTRPQSRDHQDNATMVEPSMRMTTRSNSAEHHRDRPRTTDDEIHEKRRREDAVGEGEGERRGGGGGHATKAKEKHMLSKEGYHVSLILTNTGSVARDHLASERTFLAYVRTSLALASTGVGESFSCARVQFF
jgi:hypothetical protein